MTTLVRFLRPSPPYNAGETAGFDERVAARLIGAGVVERLRPAAAPAPRAAAFAAPPAHAAEPEPFVAEAEDTASVEALDADSVSSGSAPARGGYRGGPRRPRPR